MAESHFVFSRFLTYFVEVARLGSIRKASEQLNVAASAVNKQILQAEAAFGAPLFERRSTGLRLTSAGEMLLREAVDWRRDFDRLKVHIEDLKGLRRGHVRVATLDALTQGFAPRVVTGMRQQNPGIHCTVNVYPNEKVLAEIVNGDADFGLMLDPQTSRDVVVQAHADIPFGFAARPDHPILGAPRRRFNACEDYPLIAPAPPLVIYEQWRALLASSGVTPQVAAWSNNVQMMKSLAREGAGVAVLSWIDVMEDVARGDLGFAIISDKTIRPLTLALVVAQARQLSHAANLCLAGFEDAFQRILPPVEP